VKIVDGEQLHVDGRLCDLRQLHDCRDGHNRCDSDAGDSENTRHDGE
jgi:hypothetical protein